MSEPRARWWRDVSFVLLMLIALLVIGAGIGLRDPWPSDEPRFALAAKQMVESGDWLFPHRGIELYSDKPPLLMWAEAAAFELTRSWRVAFLLPSLIASLMTLVVVRDLGSRLWNPRVGLLAAGALLCAGQFVYQAKRAQIDPLVVFWITLANAGLLLHFIRGPDWRAYWIGCFAAGLGVITKGVGVLAFLMFVPYLAARWRGWNVLRDDTRANALSWLGGLLAFVGAVALWLVPMLIAAHLRAAPEYRAYVHDILFHQTAGRYLASWDHAHSPFFYVPVVLLGWFPLSLAYVSLAPRWRDAIAARDARVVLPLAWIALVIVFFLVPSAKRDVYLMPALPMLALAAAPYLDDVIPKRGFRIASFSIALAIGALLAIVGGSAVLDHPLVGRLGGHAIGGDEARVALAIGIAMLVAALAFGLRRGVFALLAALAAMWIAWSLAGYPAFNDASSAAGVMRRAGEAMGAHGELGLVAWKEQNRLMADRPARDFGFGEPWSKQYVAARRWQDAAPERRWIFILEDAMGTCVDRARAIDLGRANRREWWLFRADAAVPGCVPADGVDAEE